MIKRWLKIFVAFLRKLTRQRGRKSLVVCFLPIDIRRAPTIVSGVRSIRQARRHLKRIGTRLSKPYKVYVDGPKYRAVCKQRNDARKALQ